MHLHDSEYYLKIYYAIAFGTAFHCNIFYVAFHCFAYMLIENCIHSSLACYPYIFQFEEHHSIAVHPYWCPKECMIIKVHLNLIVSRESIHERHPFKPTHVVYHDIRDWKGELIFRACLI